MKALSKKLCLHGSKLALENSAALVKVGRSACKLGEYGACRSLMILSAEEAMKSLWIMMQSLFDIPIENFDKFFTDHKVKHSHIKDLLAHFIEDVETYQKSFDRFIKKLRTKRFPKPVDLLTAHPRMAKEYRRVQRHKRNPIKLEHAISWWEAANQEKNNGFYVNLISGKVHNPRSYTKEDAIEAVNNCIVIYDAVDIAVGDFAQMHENDERRSWLPTTRRKSKI